MPYTRRLYVYDRSVGNRVVVVDEDAVAGLETFVGRKHILLSARFMIHVYLCYFGLTRFWVVLLQCLERKRHRPAFFCTILDTGKLRYEQRHIDQ